MTRLSVTVSEEVAQRIRIRANADGLSVSAYLRKLLVKSFDREWPEGFKESHLGKWQGPPVEIERLPAQERDLGDDWPEGYWDQIEAGWKGEKLVRPDQ